jgi:hypothetical protein
MVLLKKTAKTAKAIANTTKKAFSKTKKAIKNKVKSIKQNNMNEWYKLEQKKLNELRKVKKGGKKSKTKRNRTKKYKGRK